MRFVRSIQKVQTTSALALEFLPSIPDGITLLAALYPRSDKEHCRAADASRPFPAQNGLLNGQLNNSFFCITDVFFQFKNNAVPLFWHTIIFIFPRFIGLTKREKFFGASPYAFIQLTAKFRLINFIRFRNADAG